MEQEFIIQGWHILAFIWAMGISATITLTFVKWGLDKLEKEEKTKANTANSVSGGKN